MKKFKKMERLDLIIKLITRSQEGMSIDEIYQAITQKLNIVISRKTLERDLAEILKSDAFFYDRVSSQKIIPLGIRDCVIHLTNEEIIFLNLILPPDHSILMRWKSDVRFDKF